MAGIIYGLCAFTALLCAGLLLLAYARSRYRLLLWGGLCFVGLTINNALVIADELFLKTADLSNWRAEAALLSMIILLYGLIFDTE